MPQYLGSTKHFVSKVKEAAVQFTTNFVNANHANLSAATTVNEALAEFCEATYACNAQWHTAVQNVPTTIRATRIGNRVSLNIDAFRFALNAGASGTRITFTKKLDPRFVPNYDGVATVLGTTIPKIVLGIPAFIVNGVFATGVTAVGLYIYGDGTITIETLDTSATQGFGDPIAANAAFHGTYDLQSITATYDVIAGALKLMP